MADANEWNEARLLGLIQDKIEESHTWEYKSAGALGRDKREKDNIAKDVSAMANASGGTVIYGMAEFSDEPRKYLPEKITPIDHADFSKEWLEHVISEIEPPIAGLKIVPVRLSGGSVYIVEIPQGSTAHQATDWRYYRRRNFEIQPMLDHEVRDVMNRVKGPRIELEMRPYVTDSANGILYGSETGILNSSDVVTAYEISVRFTALPPNLRIPPEIWKPIKTYDEGGKFLLQHPLHPGDRYPLAKWQMGTGTADLGMFMSETGPVQKRKINEAKFSGLAYKIAVQIFAKDQAAMTFDCHFSKEEIEKLKTLRFAPTKMRV